MYSLALSWKRACSLIITTVLSYGVLAAPVPDKSPQVLDIAKVIKLLVNQGYSDIRKIELSDNFREYEVEALSPNGRRVEIELDAKSGKILEVERD